jgi:hypothetical protein
MRARRAVDDRHGPFRPDGGFSRQYSTASRFLISSIRLSSA